MTSRYRMLIEWSEEDQDFVVTLPEFPCNRTHGTTYEEAAKNLRQAAQEIKRHPGTE